MARTPQPINGTACLISDKYPQFRSLGRAAYTTVRGAAYCGDALTYLPKLPDDSVDLIFTSPPFALRRKKEYGNEPAESYVAWFLGFAHQFYRVLKPSGSLVIDIGGSWEKGSPTKSLYHYKLLIALVEQVGFHLAQEVFWFNPARLPSPAQWVCVERKRLKDAVNFIWWLSKTPDPKADNRRVLTEYKRDQQALVNGQAYNSGRRPSEHVISEKFGQNNGGAIAPNCVDESLLNSLVESDSKEIGQAEGYDDPANFIRASNTASNDAYLVRCRESGRAPHPARIPPVLPEFFIRFLTESDDLVLDPFAGSNTTGAVAERLSRHWIALEQDGDYLRDSRFRFWA